MPDARRFWVLHKQKIFAHQDLKTYFWILLIRGEEGKEEGWGKYSCKVHLANDNRGEGYGGIRYEKRQICPRTEFEEF